VVPDVPLTNAITRSPDADVEIGCDANDVPLLVKSAQLSASTDMPLGLLSEVGPTSPPQQSVSVAPRSDMTSTAA
jgi:hypothetical protein